LRSPLSAVLGLSAVLEASPGLSTVQREHLRTIIASGEDLLGLINNVLDFAKLESHSVELERIPFSLRDLCEGALDIIASIAQKKDIEVCLVSSIARDPPALLGDPFRVKQVLMNLLSNGVKFTSEGRVTVRWEYEEIDDKIKVTLRIDDTGIGIPASKMDKLFRSFSQVDESITRSFGGSGLGLVISRNLAQLLGGDCTASSEYGKGSTFSFSFMCERDQEVKEIKRFPEPQSCFVICQTGPWWDMLQEK
jgi:signal transduction histidine kinase